MMYDRSGQPDCDAGHYLVVAKLGRDWQRVNKTQSSYGDVQSQEIKQGRDKQQYLVEILNRFAA
ncbi:MAG: hypothetical protein LBD88_00245, partial [Candidatus Peribacteria bacterium]|nr:hypothetical protein [Candidatus Peribacteria bacterium]